MDVRRVSSLEEELLLLVEVSKRIRARLREVCAERGARDGGSCVGGGG